MIRTRLTCQRCVSDTWYVHNSPFICFHFRAVFVLLPNLACLSALGSGRMLPACGACTTQQQFVAAVAAKEQSSLP